MKEAEERIIAVCGLDCTGCPLRKASLGDAEAAQMLVGWWQAEGWLKERPNDAQLLLALGRICLMNQQWQKAREYLELSLRLQRSDEVYGELGRLCSALGDNERGSEYLRLAIPALPDLPLPDPERLDAQRERGAGRGA